METGRDQRVPLQRNSKPEIRTNSSPIRAKSKPSPISLMQQQLARQAMMKKITTRRSSRSSLIRTMRKTRLQRIKQSSPNNTQVPLVVTRVMMKNILMRRRCWTSLRNAL
jgi:hypothetical protein